MMRKVWEDFHSMSLETSVIAVSASAWSHLVVLVSFSLAQAAITSMAGFACADATNQIIVPKV